ncbi:hypothetical protein RCH06_000157 [Polaromonas sp. CG_9.5]|uniref:hypothetical protein n=1 Tax=Polaromonas sp. CG_9.5 TaxID=3071705 RepID=UPI002E0B95FF|nr:hypothetical protein [Polaromonas sp. CG_9.5]
MALNDPDVQAGVMDFNGSATCADSRSKERSDGVATPGDTLSKYPLEVRRASQRGIPHSHSL